MRTALLAHTLDIGTFLILAPIVVPYELGYIGQVYLAGGLLLCLAWKAAGLSVAFGLATKAPRYQRVILLVAALGGVIGAASNTYALWQLRSIVT